MAEDAVDFGWVMEVTFVVTVLVGAPIVAIGSLLFDIGGWTDRLVYATTVAAAVWFVTAVVVYGYARRRLRRPRGRAGR